VVDPTSLSYFRNGDFVERVLKADVSHVEYSRKWSLRPSVYEEHPTVKLLLKNGDTHIVSYFRLDWKHRAELLDGIASQWGPDILSPEVWRQMEDRAG